MPLIEDDDSPALDTGRLTFRERLRTGRAVPIVSNRAIYDRLLGGCKPFFDAATLVWFKAGHGDLLQ